MRLRIAGLAIAFITSHEPGWSQIRPVVDTTSAAAASGLSAILKVYQRELASNARDAGLWHDMGLVAWRLSSALKAGAVTTAEQARVSRLADSGLAMAAALEASNVQYQLDMAWKLQASNLAVSRAGSRRYLERAVTAARLKSDGVMRAVAALEYGRTFWWRFDAIEHRYLFTGLRAPRSVTDAQNPLARAGAELEKQASILAAADASGKSVSAIENLGPMDLARLLINVSAADMQFAIKPRGTFSSALSLLRSTSKALPNDLSGTPELERASELFSEAYQAAPAYPGTFRSVAMTWVARELWGDLERFASAHLRALPRDSIAWLALGLAQHRQGKVQAARRTFDSALVLLGPSERERLMTWRRMVPEQALKGMRPEELRAREELYWRTAMPFWADSGRDPRIEFLARVTYAELRWTVDEFGLSGADSDRGDVFIRHGPPAQVMGFGSSVDDAAADVVSFWIYDSGLIFAFSGMPTFGIMRTPNEDLGTVGELKARFPVGWDNIDAPTLDSLPMSATRFRAGDDSVEIAVAVGFPPPDSIAATMSVASAVRAHLWLVSTTGGQERHTSVPLSGAGVRLWRDRVSPSTFVYRAEAFAETATLGARATGMIDATRDDFPLNGFGISDILLASAVTESQGRGRRWSDLQIAPVTNNLVRTQELSLVWENYQFGEREGQSQYDVTIAIGSRQRGGAGKIAADLIGAIARIARVERADDRITFSFTRSVAAAPAFADWVSVQMTGTPAGQYDVSVTVVDRVTQQQASRSFSVRVRE